MADNQQVLGVPPPPNISSNASSLVPTPATQNYTLTTSSNNVDDVDRNSALVNETLVSIPASAPDLLPLPPQPTATPPSTPLPPPPTPNVATPSPQPAAVPRPSPSVSPPPPLSPVSPTPPPLPPPSSPPPTPTPSPPPPPPPRTSKVSPSPPPPQPVILSPPPPVSPPPPRTTVAPPSLHVPPSPSPPLPPNNSSAPSITPIIPTPVRPSHSIPPPGRNHSTDSPSTTPSSRHSGDSTSSSSTSHDSWSSRGDFQLAAVVGGSIAAVVALALLALMLFITKKMKKRTNSSNSEYKPPPNTTATNPDVSPAESSFGLMAYRPGMAESGVSKSLFTYEELKDITAGFSQENLLGQGGFGCVYKGGLPDGRTVAVKQLKVGGGQGEREFRAEVEIISRVHHRHLVSLVGYCISENNQLLVYEYVPNRTLEHHLHAKGLPVMEWSKRVKIAIGSARGLAYLHEDCHPRIIHRDIKSANILLDDCFEAQVADFGLAKLTNDSNTHVSTRVMGTFGYMAPEYASSGKLTDRSDVFSFGVVLLELITGRKPVDESQPLGEESLVEWARPVLVHTLETGDCEELVDPRLENNFLKSEMMMMIEAAAACVRHNASKRPRMVQVVRALDSMSEMTDLSNGVRYGESTVFNSRQYSEEIRRFQRAAFASGEFSSDFGTSGEHERRISIFSGEEPKIP